MMTSGLHRSVMDARGRVYLNKALREQLGLPNGGRVEWFVNANGEYAIRAAEKETESG